MSVAQGATVATTTAKPVEALLELQGIARYFDVSPPWLDRVIERKPTCKALGIGETPAHLLDAAARLVRLLDRPEDGQRWAYVRTAITIEIVGIVMILFMTGYLVLQNPEA